MPPSLAFGAFVLYAGGTIGEVLHGLRRSSRSGGFSLAFALRAAAIAVCKALSSRPFIFNWIFPQSALPHLRQLVGAYSRRSMYQRYLAIDLRSRAISPLFLLLICLLVVNFRAQSCLCHQRHPLGRPGRVSKVDNTSARLKCSVSKKPSRAVHQVPY